MPETAMFGMSSRLKVFVAACLATGSIFTGANGLTIVPLLAAAAMLAVGIAATSESGRDAQLVVPVLGIMASTFSVMGTAFVLTSNSILPFGATAVIAAVPVLAWISLGLTMGRPGATATA
ncbi:hypothetical protein [Glutamicibacter creatinolyticus]|nr:hypothetical protein [Glutamicibacter creatinolyticus]